MGELTQVAREQRGSPPHVDLRHVEVVVVRLLGALYRGEAGTDRQPGPRQRLDQRQLLGERGHCAW